MKQGKYTACISKGKPTIPGAVILTIQTMLPRASFVAVLLGLNLIVHAQERTPAESAQQLVSEVISNELHDSGCDSFWQYRSFRVSGSQSVVREQVETPDGPLFRLIEDHGNPLDSVGRKREDLRLQELVQKPDAMARVRQEHLQDEERMRRVIEMLPQAFLFEYDGPNEGDQIRLSFRPNPVFTPASYEARVVHAFGAHWL
jgi:hypothetical protein